MNPVIDAVLTIPHCQWHGSNKPNLTIRHWIELNCLRLKKSYVRLCMYEARLPNLTLNTVNWAGTTWDIQTLTSILVMKKSVRLICCLTPCLPHLGTCLSTLYFNRPCSDVNQHVYFMFMLVLFKKDMVLRQTASALSQTDLVHCLLSLFISSGAERRQAKCTVWDSLC